MPVLIRSVDGHPAQVTVLVEVHVLPLPLRAADPRRTCSESFRRWRCRRRGVRANAGHGNRRSTGGVEDDAVGRPPFDEMLRNVRPLAANRRVGHVERRAASGDVVAPDRVRAGADQVPLPVAVNVELAPFSVTPPEKVNVDVPLAFRMIARAAGVGDRPVEGDGAAGAVLDVDRLDRRCC